MDTKEKVQFILTEGSLQEVSKLLSVSEHMLSLIVDGSIEAPLIVQAKIDRVYTALTQMEEKQTPGKGKVAPSKKAPPSTHAKYVIDLSSIHVKDNVGFYVAISALGVVVGVPLIGVIIDIVKRASLE